MRVEEEIGGVLKYAGQRTRGSSFLVLSHAGVWRRGCLRRRAATQRPMSAAHVMQRQTAREVTAHPLWWSN